MNYHNIIKKTVLIFGYAAIFLLSEYLYRNIYNIPTIRHLSEAYIINVSFVLFMVFVKYRFTKIIIWLFFTISIIANNIHYEVYKSWINSTNYLLMFIELDEVSAAGNSMLAKLFIPTIWGIIESLLFASIAFVIKPKKGYRLVDTVFILLLVFICVRSFYTTQQHGISPNPDYSRLKANYFTLGHFIGRIIPYYCIDLSDVPTYSIDEPNVESPPKIKNIIFVVGESQNINNMGVFGYHRDTTPFLSYLDQYNPQAVIKPTISGAVMTAISLPTLFNAIEKPNGSLQISKGTTNLFYLAKKQGYNTQFYSAQAENQMMIMNIIGLRWIDKLVFPTELGYKKSDNMPDSYLINYLKEVNLNSSQPNFIILHQRGSHVPYGTLLNDDDRVFGTETIIDKYDNTIHKTDQILQSIYDYLNSTGKNDWILVFTSDHGQNVSNETFNHGQFTASSYTVPTLIYSPNYHIQSNIKEQLDKCNVLYHQQISTLLISLMGYDRPISDCKIGYVNGNLLTGDSGYLEINQQTGEIKNIQ